MSVVRSSGQFNGGGSGVCVRRDVCVVSKS